MGQAAGVLCSWCRKLVSSTDNFRETSNPLIMSTKPQFLLCAFTGDRKHAGTNANIYIILYDDSGNKSDIIHLDKPFRDEFDKDSQDVFEVSESQVKNLEKITKVEFWRDDSGFGSDWYLDKITVENRLTHATFVFPVFRWIRPFHHYFIRHLDTSLPQHDENRKQREEELQEKRKSYKFSQKSPGLPVQVPTLFADEQFSFDYKWNMAERWVQLSAQSNINKLFTGTWESFQDVINVYDDVFPTPRGAKSRDTDLYFGLQRICSLNNSVIELCTAIPDKLPVTEAMLEPLLEGLTIQQALDQKRLFICDLNILEGLPTKPGFVLCVPIGLFFVDKDNQLRPVAIQLFQSPGPDNPVFLPTDDPWLWELVKMWYNNADAAYHQSLIHLGFTHLLMEGVVITTHRQLSQSHPVFKLLAPHFHFLIAVNALAIESLVSIGGWVDQTMTTGVSGMFELIRRSLPQWRLDVNGTLPEDLKRRGLDDPKVLPGYHFRNDGLLLFDAIHKYVTAYVNLYYDNPEKLTGDREIQNWVAELVKPRDSDRGGCGLMGVPGEGSLTRTEQLVTILTSFIFTCSVGHAAANFSQYDEYAYPPSYPSLLWGQPPKSKAAVKEGDILKALPDKPVTLDIMVITSILSEKNTDSLGHFVPHYIFDPQAICILKEFLQDLKRIGEEIDARNAQRTFPYYDLHPSRVPNSIAI